MNHLPSLTNIKPSQYNSKPYTNNNTIHTSLPTLYAGGRNWILRTSDPTTLYSLPLNHSLDIHVDLFVIDKGFVIWFNDLETFSDAGLVLGYDGIINHSIRRIEEEERLELMVEVRRDGILSAFDSILNIGVQDDISNTVYFSFVPMFSEVDRYYQDHIEPVFKFQYFGSNRGNTMVGNVFNGISQCCHFNEEEADMDMNNDKQNKNHIVHSYKRGLVRNRSCVFEQDGPENNFYNVDGYCFKRVRF